MVEVRKDRALIYMGQAPLGPHMKCVEAMGMGERRRIDRKG